MLKYVIDVYSSLFFYVDIYNGICNIDFMPQIASMKEIVKALVHILLIWIVAVHKWDQCVSLTT